MQLSQSVRAIYWMVISCIAFAGLWVMIRLASQELHPFVVVVWRNICGLAWLLPMVAHTPSLLKTDRLPSHAKRATSGVIATFALFYAVAHAPMANVMAINYTAPLIATIFAMLFMGEQVRIVRGLAVCVGFLGVLLVLRPGVMPITPGLGAAILAAIATAFSQLAIKRLTGQDDSRAVAVWSFLLMTPVSIVLALPWWQWPSGPVWAILFGLGACAAAGQVALARALSLADASAVLPYDFVRFGLVTMAGIALFAERYDMLTLVGGAVILLSTIVLAVRERAKREQAG